MSGECSGNSREGKVARRCRSLEWLLFFGLLVDVISAPAFQIAVEDPGLDIYFIIDISNSAIDFTRRNGIGRLETALKTLTDRLSKKDRINILFLGQAISSTTGGFVGRKSIEINKIIAGIKFKQSGQIADFHLLSDSLLSYLEPPGNERVAVWIYTDGIPVNAEEWQRAKSEEEKTNPFPRELVQRLGTKLQSDKGLSDGFARVVLFIVPSEWTGYQKLNIQRKAIGEYWKKNNKSYRFNTFFGENGEEAEATRSALNWLRAKIEFKAHYVYFDVDNPAEAMRIKIEIHKNKAAEEIIENVPDDFYPNNIRRNPEDKPGENEPVITLGEEVKVNLSFEEVKDKPSLRPKAITLENLHPQAGKKYEFHHVPLQYKIELSTGKGIIEHLAGTIEIPFSVIPKNFLTIEFDYYDPDTIWNQLGSLNSPGSINLAYSVTITSNEWKSEQFLFWFDSEQRQGLEIDSPAIVLPPKDKANRGFATSGVLKIRFPQGSTPPEIITRHMGKLFGQCAT